MKILLIDNHTLFREGLRHMLQQLPNGVDVILEADNFPDGFTLAGQHHDLNLALLELKSPGGEGGIAVKLFCQRYPHIPVVLVSSEENCYTIKKALSYGACGFVCKSSTESILLSTLGLALSGSIYVPPQLPQQAIMAGGRKDDHKDNCCTNGNKRGLTTRQMHVLKFLAAGLSNKEIALTINIAESTVKAHVAAVYQALRINNRLEAMRVAKRLGLHDNQQVDFVFAHPSHCPKQRRINCMVYT